jgi:uncharacterized protein
VHWLIENKKINFCLCGSSARKLKRGHANLLGGRAWRRELLGLSAYELGSKFDLLKMLNNGYLPSHYFESDYKENLRSYVHDYLKEEIMAEGLIRNLPAFSNFLNAACLSDSELVVFDKFASDVGVSSTSIKSYFEILEDTFIGSYLRPFRLRPKRRISLMSKFYFFDVGVVNYLAKRGTLKTKSELFGKAFENWIYHVCTEKKSRKTEDGIEILPFDVFIERLWSGKII